VKASIVAFGLLAAVTTASPAAAADVDTVIAACVGHPNGDRPLLVTQIVRLTAPWLPEGSTYPTTMLSVQDAFRNVMINRNAGLWKEQCYSGDSVDAVRRAIEKREGLSNYPAGKKVELAYDGIWPEMIQWMKGVMPVHRWITHSMYGGEVVGSMFTKTDIQLSESKDKERRESEARAKIPPTKVIITGGDSAPSRPKMTSAEADAKYEADLANYRAAMAEHDAAVERYKKRLEAMDASKADKAQAAQQANAAYQAELAKAEAAKAEYERQRQAYREEYKRITGSYPDR
jgi:hypothetical protein